MRDFWLWRGEQQLLLPCAVDTLPIEIKLGLSGSALNTISLPSGDQIGSRLMAAFEVTRLRTSRSSASIQISGGCPDIPIA